MTKLKIKSSYKDFFESPEMCGEIGSLFPNCYDDEIIEVEIEVKSFKKLGFINDKYEGVEYNFEGDE